MDINVGVSNVQFIFLNSVNGMKSNQLKPVWLMDPKEVDAELHNDFYRNITRECCAVLSGSVPVLPGPNYRIIMFVRLELSVGS